MSIYSNRYLFEDAVEDAIQTPDDVGNSLDDIEDAIMGDDGIEAHTAEVDYANEIPDETDPIGESTRIVYETTYNFNRICEAIGLREVNEAARGREFFLEAGGIGAFFDKVWENLKKLFTKVLYMFKAALTTLKEKGNIDARFVSKYKAAIEAGAAGDWGDKTFSGYTFRNIEKGATLFNKNTEEVSAYIKDLTIDKVMSSDTSVELRKTTVRDMLLRGTGVVAHSDNGTFKIDREELTKSLFGEKYDAFTAANANQFEGGYAKWVCNVLSGGDIKLVSDAEKNFKKAMKDTESAIKKAKADAISKLTKTNDKEADKNAKSSIDGAAHTICDVITSAKTYESTIHGVLLNALKARRAQARIMAYWFAGKGKKAVKGTAKNESYVFSGLDLI